MDLTEAQKQALYSAAVDFAIDLWNKVGKDVAIVLIKGFSSSFDDGSVIRRFFDYIAGLMTETDVSATPMFDVVQYIIDDDHNCLPICDDDRLGGKGCE